MCGNDAAAVTAANIYADKLRDHDLLFLEERILSVGRIMAFCRRRLRSSGAFSLLGSLAYYGLRLVNPPKMPVKRYIPNRTADNFNTDPAIREAISTFKPDAVLVCFCSILGPELLALLPDATYNIHPGINPRYRGFGNIWAAYENNLGCLGYTIHKIDAGTDTGERIAVVVLSPRELANIPLTDIDIPVSSRAATHMAELLLGRAEAAVPETCRDMPSRLYGVPTFGVFRGACRNMAAALRASPGHVLITGASSGVGKALAEEYAAPGTRLTLWARDPARLDAVAGQCREKGAVVRTVCQDVRDIEQSRAVLARIHAEDPVDTAILGAGVTSGTLPDGSPEPATHAWHTMTVNGTAAIVMAGTMLELMGERGTGHVVCLSSIAAFYPLPDSPAYCAAKAALTCYAKAMRPLVRPVRISLVYPGYVDTPMSRKLSGAQPLRWSAEKAASHIRNRLDTGAKSVVFPLPLALGLLLLHGLPSYLADFFVKRFGFAVTPDPENTPGTAREPHGKSHD